MRVSAQGHAFFIVQNQRQIFKEKRMSFLDEIKLEREQIYSGRILNIVKDRVRLPNGEEATRELALHPGAVAILPLLDDGRVIMERQYRYAHGRVFLEIPAGKLDYIGEEPLDAAKRELREETGAVAKSYTDLGKLIPSPAVLTEVIYMYLAEGIVFSERELDEDEFIDLELIPLEELYQMTLRGEIEDAKTQIAILKAYELKK